MVAIYCQLIKTIENNFLSFSYSLQKFQYFLKSAPYTTKNLSVGILLKFIYMIFFQSPSKLAIFTTTFHISRSVFGGGLINNLVRVLIDGAIVICMLLLLF